MTVEMFTMLLTAGAPFIAALASLGAMMLSWQNRVDIKTVKHATNSMKDELVAATKLASKAEGKVEEQTEAAARHAIKSEGVLQGRVEGQREQGVS